MNPSALLPVTVKLFQKHVVVDFFLTGLPPRCSSIVDRPNEKRCSLGLLRKRERGPGSRGGWKRSQCGVEGGAKRSNRQRSAKHSTRHTGKRWQSDECMEGHVFYARTGAHRVRDISAKNKKNKKVPVMTDAGDLWLNLSALSSRLYGRGFFFLQAHARMRVIRRRPDRRWLRFMHAHM